MNTVARVQELIQEKSISLRKLAQLSDVPYSTLKVTQHRQGQLAVDTIEKLCQGLGITMSEFFDETFRLS